MPDKPFLRTYKIDFVNMSRAVKSSVSTSTQIASATSGGAGSASGNTASTAITSDTKNDLMESLISNVTAILKEEDRIRYRTLVETEVGIQAKAEGTGKIAAGITDGSKTKNPDGSTEVSGSGGSVAGSGDQKADLRAAATKKVGEYEPSIPVFANKETGVLIVRATSRQHEKVQQFVDQVMKSAKRQVLLEATIVEINLKNEHAQGVDWQKVGAGLVAAGTLAGNSIAQATAATTGLLGFKDDNNMLTFQTTNSGRTFQATLRLLENFGNIKVLSSPKVSVMNNQTATLKVADNKVFFTMKADTALNNGASLTTYTTTPNSVTVGFIMNVTPQISDNDEVTINVRPTITRITNYIEDPNPSLATAGVKNLIPEIQTREMESIIKVNSGHMAVMGGLMQEELTSNAATVPGAASFPIFGNLFKNATNMTSKTELVIFLRPIVIKDASIEGDYSGYRENLPGPDFFDKNNVGPKRQQLDFGGLKQ
jgi:general secretion pathway protein D